MLLRILFHAATYFRALFPCSFLQPLACLKSHKTLQFRALWQLQERFDSLGPDAGEADDIASLHGALQPALQRS